MYGWACLLILVSFRHVLFITRKMSSVTDKCGGLQVALQQADCNTIHMIHCSRMMMMMSKLLTQYLLHIYWLLLLLLLLHIYMVLTQSHQQGDWAAGNHNRKSLQTTAPANQQTTHTLFSLVFVDRFYLLCVHKHWNIQFYKGNNRVNWFWTIFYKYSIYQIQRLN